MPSFNFIKFKNLFDFLRVKSTSYVLLVAEDHQCSTRKLLLSEQFLQFVTTALEPKLISAIYNPNQSIRLFEVIAPVAANCCLSAYVPEVQLEVIVLYSFNLETKCWRDFACVFSEKLL